MDDQPPQRGAALSTRADRCEDDRSHRQFQVGRRCDDHAVVAAQFEQAATEPGGHRWATSRPIGTEPVAETSGIPGCSAIACPTSAPPMMTLLKSFRGFGYDIGRTVRNR